jgi:hypothetical protein
VADLKIRHEIRGVADARKVELRCTPTAELRYTLDGTNPKEGAIYTEPFDVPAKGGTVWVAAKAGEAEKTTTVTIPPVGDDRVVIEDSKPAQLTNTRRVALDTTDKVFNFIHKFKTHTDTRLRGVQIVLGEGENAVQVRFNERRLTAAAIEAAIDGIRQAVEDDHTAVQVLIRGGIEFGDGFRLKEFAEIADIELKAGDVLQDAD